MESERQRLEHQIELATRAASFIKDETTVERLLRFADELKHTLFLSSRRRKIRTRAYQRGSKPDVPRGGTGIFGLKQRGRSGGRSRTFVKAE
jgi:hypothetical protein